MKPFLMLERRLLKERIKLRRPLITRYTLVAGTLGLLAGAGEAAVLYFACSFTSIFYLPLVHYVIWFVAPLIDMALFGLLGFLMGLSLSLSRQIRPWLDALLTFGLASLAASWPILVANPMAAPVRDILRRWSPDWIFHLMGAIYAIVWHPPALVAVGGAVLVFLVRRIARRIGEIQWPLGILARVLAGAVAVCVGGIAIYAFTQRSWPGQVEANSIPPARGPNIILITLDTLRADHLSAYGYARATTPNLDRLARRGVLFENAISSSSWTVPSHASIFTGLPPHQHGADYHLPLKSGLQTLAMILHTRGYQTAQFSANWWAINSNWGLTQGFEVSLDYTMSIRHHLWSTLAGDWAAGLYSHFDFTYLSERIDANAVNHTALEWFAQRSSRPFFLFLNYMEPHAPYVCASSGRGPFGRISWPLAYRTGIDWAKLAKPLSPAEQSAVINAYDNCLLSMDANLGALFRSLANSPNWSNTVVILTADHGEALGDRGGIGHGWNLYSELIHVPLIALGPGVPDHLRVHQVVDSRDIFATVLDFALGNEGMPFRRSSLQRFWTANPEPPNDLVVSELSHPDKSLSNISLTTGEWKYIANPDGEAELYDWSKDPGETKNLASMPEYGPAVMELHNQLCQELGSTLDPLYGAPYLGAVQATPNSSPAQAALSCGLRLPLPRPTLRPEDEDLLRTLPYR